MKKVTLSEVIKMSLLKDCIYYRCGLEGDWNLFLDKFNEPFYDLLDAINYFRNNKELFIERYYELSCFEQSKLGNAEWDNI